MFSLIRDLNLCIVRGLLSRIRGCGKAYLKHNALICANQELSVSVMLVSILLAMVFSKFPKVLYANFSINLQSKGRSTNGDYQDQLFQMR